MGPGDICGGTEPSVRVLFVDDDPMLREVVADYLERTDDTLRVVTEPSVEAARWSIETDSIDCIVSDHRMPETTGIEFCSDLRSEGTTLPFILLTGQKSQPVVDAALEAGVSDVMEKGAGTDTYDRVYEGIKTAIRRTRIVGQTASPLKTDGWK